MAARERMTGCGVNCASCDRTPWHVTCHRRHEHLVHHGPVALLPWHCHTATGRVPVRASGNWGQPSAILGRPVGPGILSPSGRVMLPHASLTPDDITMAARIYAMLHAHQELMDKAQKGGLTCHVTTMSHKPDVTKGPSQFYHDLCLGHEYTLSGLATPARATPMSTIAQGAAGVLLPSTTHYINADHQHALIYGRLGTRQLFHHPGPEVWRLGDAKSKEAMQLVNKGLQCPSAQR